MATACDGCHQARTRCEFEREGTSRNRPDHHALSRNNMNVMSRSGTWIRRWLRDGTVISFQERKRRPRQHGRTLPANQCVRGGGIRSGSRAKLGGSGPPSRAVARACQRRKERARNSRQDERPRFLGANALERAAGIEPATLAWKARALPLCNARARREKCGPGWI
jgi:hypothetical protein